MLETAIALAFGHVLADFTFQTDGIVRNKHKPHVLFAHIAIVALTAWAALGLPPDVWPITLIAGSHLVIDALKIRFGGPGLRAFAVDQAAHLAMLAATAIAFPATWATGLWTRPELTARLPLDPLPEAMLLATGLIAAVWAGGHAVGALMQGIEFPADPGAESSLPQGGRLIGQLERLMIYGLVLTGEVVGIGLLIAAKSLLRFGEVQAGASRQTAEYVIIGTLASFAWALAVSIAVARLLPLVP
jgi:hypothetical protein